MAPFIPPFVFALVLFVGMFLMLDVGRRLGIRRRSRESETERTSLGTIEGAVFALFGLVVAFTFSGAISRFNEKRTLIAEEANTVETAYLRLSLLPVKAQPELQALFRQYIDSRLETYRNLPDMDKALAEMKLSKKLQKQIWVKSVAATQSSDAHVDAGKLLLPALNNMIDITTTRKMALQTHPPSVIYLLLFVLGLICSMLAGYRMANGRYRSWLHIMSFSLMTVVIAYVIVDVEYPRAGLIRLQGFDQSLMDVRDAMN